MGMQIEDGTGAGHRAKVGRRGHLFTLALNFPIAGFFSGEGDGFNMPVDFQSYVTTGSERLLAFLQNDRAAQFYLSKITLAANAEFRFRAYKAPDGRTGGVAVTPVNTNFDSGQQFIGTFERGEDAATLQGGTLLGSHLSLGGDSVFPTDEVIILGQGKSIGLTVEIPAAADIACTIWGHYFA